MIADVYRAALEAIDSGEAFAVATVITAAGSSPGKPGHKMLLTASGRRAGTIGGGQLEQHVIGEMNAMLGRGQGAILDYSFRPGAENNPGLTCGGSVTIAVEVVQPPARVLLCGGGHVAQALAEQLHLLGFTHVVVDARPEVARAEAFPHAREIIHATPPEFVASGDLGRFSHVIVFTHEHALDRDTVVAVARKGFEGYVGLIGSARKWAVTRQALQEAGVDAEWIERVRCPIGLAIGARTPAEIAVSISAELVQELRTQGAPSA